VLKQTKYIFYKIINNLIYNISETLCIFKYSKNYRDYNGIFLDLDHSTTHLGDRLFLWDTIKLINSVNKTLYVSKNDKLTIEFLKIFNIKFEIFDGKIENILTVSLKPMFLYKLMNNGWNALNIKYLDYFAYDGPLSKSIAYEFSLGQDLHTKIPFKMNDRNSFQRNEKIVLFNNYVDSGRFRLKFVDEKLLFFKCKKFKSMGYKIWHVGSASDKKSDKNFYEFVDSDLRGKTNIKNIIKYFLENRITEVVSYDNFFLHLAELFEIRSHILFRGRFTKKARKKHFNSVNLGLSRENSKINYLTKL
jgi:hypothetical protein